MSEGNFYFERGPLHTSVGLYLTLMLLHSSPVKKSLWNDGDLRKRRFRNIYVYKILPKELSEAQSQLIPGHCWICEGLIDYIKSV